VASGMVITPISARRGAEAGFTAYIGFIVALVPEKSRLLVADRRNASYSEACVGWIGWSRTLEPQYGFIVGMRGKCGSLE
jgi:hypothetical protein